MADRLLVITVAVCLLSLAGCGGSDPGPVATPPAAPPATGPGATGPAAPAVAGAPATTLPIDKSATAAPLAQALATPAAPAAGRSPDRRQACRQQLVPGRAMPADSAGGRFEFCGPDMFDDTLRTGLAGSGGASMPCTLSKRGMTLSVQGAGVSANATLDRERQDAFSVGSDGARVYTVYQKGTGNLPDSELKILVRVDPDGRYESARALLTPGNGDLERQLIDCRFSG